MCCSSSGAAVRHNIHARPRPRVYARDASSAWSRCDPVRVYGFRVSRDKGRSGGGEKKTLVFGGPNRASENMNAFTVSRLIFNTGTSYTIRWRIPSGSTTAVYGIVRWKFVESDEGTRTLQRRKERQRVTETTRTNDSTGDYGISKGKGGERTHRGEGGGGGEGLLVDVVRYWGRRGTRGHECLSTVRYDAWITLPPPSELRHRARSPLFNPSRLPVFASSYNAAAGSSRSVRDLINIMRKFVGDRRNLAISFANFSFSSPGTVITPCDY